MCIEIKKMDMTHMNFFLTINNIRMKGVMADFVLSLIYESFEQQKLEPKKSHVMFFHSE